MNRETLSFLSGLSHELRTTIGAIGGHVELFEIGIHGPVTPQQSAGLARIKKNGEMAIALLEAAMLFVEAASESSQPHSDAPSSDEERSSLISVLQGAMHTLQHDADARRVMFSLAADTDVQIDEPRDKAAMTQEVMRALLRDAIEASTEGATVIIQVSRDAQCDIVEFRSQGVAFTAEVTESVFVPFDRRAQGSRTQGIPHALALPYARLLARSIGGDVFAVPVGSTRTLRLHLPRSPVHL